MPRPVDLDALQMGQQLRQMGMAPSVVSRLCQLVRRQSLAAGDSFSMKEGKLGLALVCQGTLLRQVAFHDGSEMGTALAFSGQWLFSSCSPIQRDDNVRYRCLEATELETLSGEAVLRFCHEDSRFLRFFMEHRYLYARMTEDHLLLRSLLSKRDHILLTLTMIFSSQLRRGENTIKLTIEDLASTSGATRQYYGKVITELCEAQILRNRYGCLELLDYARLKQQLGEEGLKHYQLLRAKPEADGR
ncbi:Crp/Fnr family transcriptional regulator [Ferrimonas marina]|uniref:cAMP-binding domain of CRP or a regulatory subunit of cAMP-dependent protein kinases n=1 Tax=Ferrimonas marina TaxID=299255 RepID=A0A1M5XUD7_9GAMM|nr:helix-turn-helix domain-containing protein [Ferrimonas marina]SHI03435.1 cAMP-binding domain of CRP or a regulatory subunit of cAMP-dependent protein kinases [Ferrimonas marina]